MANGFTGRQTMDNGYGLRATDCGLRSAIP